jgi:O-antigen/teichoic acid export membrane protein
VFFLGVFRSPAEVAWYALAFGVAVTVMRLLPRSLSFVLPPLASGLYGADDRAGLRTLFDAGSRYLLILAAPLIAGGALLAEPLLTAAYGEAYVPAARAFPLLLLAAGFGAVGSVTASIQTGIERQDLVLKVALAATVVNVGLDLALIPRFGIVGAAAANAVAQVGAVIAGIALTARVLDTPFPVRDCVRILSAAGGVGLLGFGVAHAVGGTGGLASGIAAAAVTYPLALGLTRALRRGDLERLHAVGRLLPAALRPGYGGLLRLAGWSA